MLLASDHDLARSFRVGNMCTKACHACVHWVSSIGRAQQHLSLPNTSIQWVTVLVIISGCIYTHFSTLLLHIKYNVVATIFQTNQVYDHTISCVCKVHNNVHVLGWWVRYEQKTAHTNTLSSLSVHDVCTHTHHDTSTYAFTHI